jgi:hypothetical protein
MLPSRLIHPGATSTPAPTLSFTTLAAGRTRWPRFASAATRTNLSIQPPAKSLLSPKNPVVPNVSENYQLYLPYDTIGFFVVGIRT